MTYRNDPRWITVKYPARDRQGNAIPKGARAFYYPATKTFLVGETAEQASRDFEAARSDEAFTSGNW